MRIDAGHLSRLLARLERRGLVARERSPSDGRRQVARLTPAGEAAFAELDRRSAEQAEARLDGLDRDRLAAALGRGAAAPGPGGRARRPPPPAAPGGPGLDRRPPRPPLRRRVRLGRQLRGPRRRDRRPLRRGARPGARGGVDRRGRRRPGRLRPVRARERHGREAAAAARRAAGARARARRAAGGRVHRLRPPRRLRELRLWTNDVLVAARRIYERAGFTMVDSERYHGFGRDLVSQTWALRL